MEALEVIRKIIEYHRVLRGQLKRAGEALPDRQAMFELARESPRWLPGKPEGVAEGQKRLSDILQALDDGLQKHFGYEEQYLPPLWGELMMRALRFDHTKTRTQLADLRTLVATAKLEELLPDKFDRQELRHEIPLYLDQIISRQAHIHDRIGIFRDLLEDHAEREEVVLRWLEKTLQAEAQAGSKA